MPFHRKAGPKQTQLEHSQFSGEYSDDVTTFLRAADQYRVSRGGAPLMASDYLHIVKEIMGYKPPASPCEPAKSLHLRVWIRAGVQERLHDAAVRLGLQPGRLVGRLVAVFANMTPRQQETLLGVSPDPAEMPFGPRAGGDD